MTRRAPLAAVALAVLALAPLAAGAAPAAAPAEPLERLAFLTGCWRGGDGDTVIEEHWLPPAGGVMVGLSRTVAKGELEIFEFLRLQAKDGAWHYVAQPNGVPPTWFRLTRLTDDEALFEQPAHDFPQKIRYRKVGDDELHAEIAGPGRDGRERSFPYRYRRAECPNALAAGD